ncbi:MAG: hypothetical protein RL108_1233, partial [Bacteroidota bacterium]
MWVGKIIRLRSIERDLSKKRELKCSRSSIKRHILRMLTNSLKK